MKSADDIRNAIHAFVDNAESEIVHYEYRKQEVSSTLNEMVLANRNVEVIYEYLSTNTPILDELLRRVLRLSNDLTLHLRECQNRNSCGK